ncbi:hypothetical protein EVAR_6096_1 [Eumeta japonica]|uniref:Uncharacterized protein n=1 Tax=Eumeta variegata TaxID=151549 RepID=A0A4C1TE02_EUMVA|nr:hypothetical protein EVAR_6096_1 [Eumeta japonica]
MMGHHVEARQPLYAVRFDLCTENRQQSHYPALSAVMDADTPLAHRCTVDPLANIVHSPGYRVTGTARLSPGHGRAHEAEGVGEEQVKSSSPNDDLLQRPISTGSASLTQVLNSSMRDKKVWEDKSLHPKHRVGWLRSGGRGVRWDQLNSSQLSQPVPADNDLRIRGSRANAYVKLLHNTYIRNFV